MFGFCNGQLQVRCVVIIYCGHVIISETAMTSNWTTERERYVTSN